MLWDTTFILARDSSTIHLRYRVKQDLDDNKKISLNFDKFNVSILSLLYKFLLYKVNNLTNTLQLPHKLT